MADNSVKFRLNLKITDAVFIIRKEKKNFSMTAVLKVYAEVAGQAIIDGDVKEMKVDKPFESEIEATEYATEKAREFKLDTFRIINPKGNEIELPT